MTNIFNNTKNNLLIIGCGGHAKVITDIARAIGFVNITYQDNNANNKNLFGKSVITKFVENFNDNFFVAIGDNFLREKITKEFKEKNPNSIATSLIHPSSVISEDSKIGEGAAIMPLCVINNSSEIGKGVIINTRSSLDHDNLLKDFSSVAPGVTTGGSVIIGSRTAISIGATIKQNIKIGSDSVIGASSYVNKNIPDEKIVYGCPAKIIRDRAIGEKYL